MPLIMKIVPKPSNAKRAPSLVAVLAYDGISTFELGIAVEIFGLPGMGPDWYRVMVCSDRPSQMLLANGGIKIVADAGLDALRGAGTIIVPGSPDIDKPPSRAITKALVRVHAPMASGSRRSARECLCSPQLVCSTGGAPLFIGPMPRRSVGDIRRSPSIPMFYTSTRVIS